jgi:DNA-binding MurR/RpiR family transcriptional regulator
MIRDIAVVAITDSPLSPLTRHARISFEVKDGEARPFARWRRRSLWRRSWS